MKYIIDIPNEMVIKSALNGLTLGIAMIETSTQKQFIIPTNIPLISHIEPQKWIPCSERMPEEHDSIFSRFYGTEKWRDAMFRKTSKIVIITVEHLDGTRQTAPCHTMDGEWNQSMKGMGKVLAWMPLPEPYKEEEE